MCSWEVEMRGVCMKVRFKREHIKPFAVYVGVAVLLDQITAFIPRWYGFDVVAHPQRRQSGAFSDPIHMLGPHIGIVNVLHTAHMTGSVTSDAVTRFGIALACFWFACLLGESWIERYVLRGICVLMAAVGISQAISFIVRGGVVDWLAITSSSGRFISAVCLSDLYVPLVVFFFLPVALVGVVAGFDIKGGRFKGNPVTR
jgi:hypothetical protein